MSEKDPLILLREIVDVQYITTVDSRTKTLSLKEDKPQSKIEKIQFRTNEPNSFMIKLDEQNNEPICLVLKKNISDIHKKPDAIIFTRNKEHYHVFIVEMKSKSPKKYIQQMQSGLAFTKYLLSLSRQHYGIKENFNFHYVLLHWNKNQRSLTRKQENEIQELKDGEILMKDNIIFHVVQKKIYTIHLNRFLPKKFR